MTVSQNTLRLAQVFFACCIALLCAVIFFRTFRDVEDAVPIAESEHLPPPVRLEIPRLNIDALVLPMGLSQRGGMEMPESADEIGWFAYSTVPGANGSAVFAGHRNTILQPNGIFRHLESLVPNDDVFVETASGQTLHFRVLASETYPYDRAPLRQIFAGSGGRLLNLITCTGVWDEWTYSERLVVYTELVKQ